MKPKPYYHILSTRVSLAVMFEVLTAACAAEPALTGDRIATKDGDLVIHPINHATLALGWTKLTLYVDPVGGRQRFAGLPKPDLILLTDIHGDHLNAETLNAVATDKTHLVAPSAVAEQLPAELRRRTTILSNGETKTLLGVTIEAVPMYNTTPERTKFHPKGRGNGYVLTFADKRVYLSGDTEDIPEMRALKEIDVAFLCMNLPYTMRPEQAASAVREFRPRIVYPYHSRGSDLEKFEKLVGDDVGVEVRLRDWYKPQGSASRDGKDPAHSSLPVIGYLEGRHGVITIKSGPQSPLPPMKTRTRRADELSGRGPTGVADWQRGGRVGLSHAAMSAQAARSVLDDGGAAPPGCVERSPRQRPLGRTLAYCLMVHVPRCALPGISANFLLARRPESIYKCITMM